MIIDFNNIPEERIEGFKGGKGELLTRNFQDDRCKMMYSRLRPGASSGLHVHEANCEIVYVLEGVLTFHYDGRTEVARAGQVHYCPRGHAHYMENLADVDAVYFAVVPNS